MGLQGFAEAENWKSLPEALHEPWLSRFWLLIRVCKVHLESDMLSIIYGLLLKHLNSG